MAVALRFCTSNRHRDPEDRYTLGEDGPYKQHQTCVLFRQVSC
jgi:hypothetical protein